MASNVAFDVLKERLELIVGSVCCTDSPSSKQRIQIWRLLRVGPVLSGRAHAGGNPDEQVQDQLYVVCHDNFYFVVDAFLRWSDGHSPVWPKMNLRQQLWRLILMLPSGSM